MNCDLLLFNSILEKKELGNALFGYINYLFTNLHFNMNQNVL